MGPHPRYVEQLRIGGGYDSTPDGGTDIEQNGHIKTNGDITVDGTVSIGKTDSGAIWFDESSDKLKIGTCAQNETPVAAVEIDKAATSTTLLGDATINGDLTVQSMTTPGLLKNDEQGQITGGHTMAATDLPEHTHTSAQQGGDYPWADITGFGTSGVSTAVARNDHIQAVNKGGTGLVVPPADGQLLIGKTATSGFALANLAGTTNRVSVANGSGTITLSTPQDIHPAANPTFNNLTLTGRLTQSGQFQGVSTEGLVALWHCETNDTLLDWSGNGHTLTAYNNPTTVPGKYGNAICFTAPNQCFSGPSTLPDALGQSNMTYAFWCCGTPPQDPRFHTPWYADGTHNFEFVFQVNGDLLSRVRGGGSYLILSSNTTVCDGVWHQVALTRTYVSPIDSTFTLYVDGEPREIVTTTDVDDIGLAASAVNVGHPWGSSPLFAFDEISVWSRAFTAQEVKSLYLRGSELNGIYGNQFIMGSLSINGNLSLSQPNIQISVDLPTVNPGPGKLWNDGGTVKIGV